ncbi:hypothetical protein NESM_000467200 [Novymonas esmeraldas]|uniref:Uncharacterized protein n=1 Tax=Novymonas esmeraldas TaxID=1808958 RepID=A0AAW0EQ75_9TRYP
MTAQPISIHYQQMEEWLVDRKSVLARKHKKEYEALLSAAPRLVQTAQYDLPALEKQRKKCETAVEECHRVGEEAQRTQLKLREKRGVMLGEYGIEPAAADGEAGVASAVDQRVTAACAAVNAAFQEYAGARVAAVREAYNALLATTAPGSFGDDPFATHFPWLQRGLSEAAYLPAGTTPGAAAGTIDDDADAPAPQIDWGDDGDGDTAASAAVAATFEDATAAAADATAAAVVQINWDATEMEARVEEDDAPPTADGLRFSIDLASTKHRVNVVAELQAAACFCSERGTPELLACSAAADALRCTLTQSKEGELARMKESYRARDGLIDRIDRFEQQMMVARTRAAAHEAKMRDAEDELATLAPQQEELVARLRGMRDDAVTHLEHMFPDRRILIVGDLNKYLL